MFFGKRLFFNGQCYQISENKNWDCGEWIFWHQTYPCTTEVYTWPHNIQSVPNAVIPFNIFKTLKQIWNLHYYFSKTFSLNLIFFAILVQYWQNTNIQCSKSIGPILFCYKQSIFKIFIWLCKKNTYNGDNCLKQGKLYMSF